VEGGDGCDSGCQVEATWSCAGAPSVCDACGNGVVGGTEACDDGPDLHVDGDGCGITCELEAGWTCAGDPSVCESTCGDGLIVGTESCDDGPLMHAPGDGCGIFCAVESGWTCSGEPSQCQTTCGDGIVAGAETCDDGNTGGGDGCDANCAIETGWVCAEDVKTPSVCWQCDGILDGHCYLLECGGGANTEWAKARAICHKRDGYLVRVDSQDENDLIDTLNVGCGDEIYMGLSDPGGTGEFAWVSESGGGSPVYTNWGYGQPDETDAGAHCVYLDELAGEPVWWDAGCAAKRAYICEVPVQ